MDRSEVGELFTKIPNRLFGVGWMLAFLLLSIGLFVYYFYLPGMTPLYLLVVPILPLFAVRGIHKTRKSNVLTIYENLTIIRLSVANPKIYIKHDDLSAIEADKKKVILSYLENGKSRSFMFKTKLFEDDEINKLLRFYQKRVLANKM